MTGTSRQEEDLMVMETIRTRGESTRDEVASELGVPSVFRTLVRLEAEGRLASRERFNATLQCGQRVFRLNDAQLTVSQPKGSLPQASPVSTAPISSPPVNAGAPYSCPADAHRLQKR